MTLQDLKQRFGIIGNANAINHALQVAMQVAPTELSVLITGESGVGKETFPQIIHQFSKRKHSRYIAVNCGAIPEGTIDSELFGHEKGSFTGALADRKGYFEEAHGGTIFLDEVGELPLTTQVRLLRVLETGEFLKVGSSTVQKTNVRVVAATNVNLLDAIAENRFREDLYYRLNTIPIKVIPLRERSDDIVLLFRKFAADFADKYRMPPIQLSDDAKNMLQSYYWPGNVRQLKNITEQISILEQQRFITAALLEKYLPDYKSRQHLPALVSKNDASVQNWALEREVLYSALFEMRKEITDLKQMVTSLASVHPNDINSGNLLLTAAKSEAANSSVSWNTSHWAPPPHPNLASNHAAASTAAQAPVSSGSPVWPAEAMLADESLSLIHHEEELIRKALEKHHGKRRNAADELGISERTLYRKIKEYGL